MDYLMCLCLFLGGTCLDSAKEIPHVIEYQTITPQKLHNPSQTSAGQQNPRRVSYSVVLGGQNRTLHLERNVDLIGRNFSVVHYWEHGAEEITMPDHKDHCYYHGHIQGVEDSSASLELCSGLKGFVRIKDQSFLLEPLAEEGETGQREGEGLHAVYDSRHLRLKRSVCAHGDQDTSLDRGARPSGMFQPRLKSSGQRQQPSPQTRTVELVLVVDHSEHLKYGQSVIARMLEVTNHVDKLYRALGVRVMLVGLEIWTHRDQIQVDPDPDVTLQRFVDWRQQTLLPRVKHDNAQLITKLDFRGDTVGLAFTGSMCSSKSGAVNQDHNNNAIGVAMTVAHEMGHNLGLSHDGPGCPCPGPARCLMAPSHGTRYPETFSSCSLDQLAQFLEERNPPCLLDSPSPERLFGGPVCGNAFLERGEECDCGTTSECKNPCCNATACRLTPGAQCGGGGCCQDCQLKRTGALCRARVGECDLSEFCTGLTATCPPDAYTQNGRQCNRGNGFCLDGQCPSRDQQCRRLWGTEARAAPRECYSSARKEPRCGALLCSGGWDYPLTSAKRFHRLASGELCNEASADPDLYPPDMVRTPAGTRCGHNKVCYEQRCQNMEDLEEVYGKEDCSLQCNGRGVCNHQRKCHCDPGWVGPYCGVRGPESTGMEPADAIGLSAAVLVLLSVGICAALMWRKTRGAQKRPRLTSSGEANPAFQSSSAQGSRRHWPPLIGQPTFVESTASQVCQAGRQPITGQTSPSRTAPQPPNKMAAVPQPPRMQQPPPPPPTRPLAPLHSKTISKPKPPVPPAKPSGSPSPWKQNRLSAARAALRPPPS